MDAKVDVRIVHDDQAVFKTMRMLLEAIEPVRAFVVLGLSLPRAKV